MKTLFILAFLSFGLYANAQVPSDSIFAKYKDSTDVTYTSKQQIGKDTVTGQPIPFFVRTLTVKAINPLYRTILSECEKVIKNKAYDSISSQNENGRKLDAKKYDKGINFEVLIFNRNTEESDYDISIISFTAKNLTESQKTQISFNNQ